MVLTSRSQRPHPRRAVAAALIAGAGLLAGCSAGNTIADHLPTAVGGMPEGVPQRPTRPSAYPAVHDMPPTRPTTVLTSRSQRPHPRLAVAAALIAGAGLLAGCSAGNTIADHLPTAVGGMPEGAPQRPTRPSAYPAVHDMPPTRPTTVLTDAEQTKLESDLVAARNRAAEAAASAAAGDKP